MAGVAPELRIEEITNFLILLHDLQHALKQDIFTITE
jgi:hypothetical protein